MNKNLFTVSKISLDPSGYYWVTYYGEILDQGGPTLGTGQVRMESLDDALAFVKHALEMSKEAIAKQIECRINKPLQ